MRRVLRVARGEGNQNLAQAQTLGIGEIQEMDSYPPGYTEVYEEAPDPNQPPLWPDRYAQATTPAQKLQVIAEFLNLTPRS